MAIFQSNTLTIIDQTDTRKLEVYIKSNMPTVQIFNQNTEAYSPDWSSGLELTADVYLDSREMESYEKVSFQWSVDDGSSTTQVSTSRTYRLTNNVLASKPILTYVCVVSYQNITATSKITFTRVDTGRNGADGTSVNIKGTATSVSAISGTDYYTITYDGSDVSAAQLNDSYMYNGDLYTCVDSRDGIDYFINVGRIQGPKGEDAKSIILTGSAQVFKVSKTNTYTPSTISVTATPINTTVTDWAYSINGGQTFISATPTGVVKSGNVITVTGSTLAYNSLVIKASDGQYSDVITIYKAFDGTDGANGNPGSSASMAFLTNENVSFSANANGEIPFTTASTFKTYVVAYNGTTKVTPTIGAISNLPSGVTAIPNKGTAYSSVTPSAGNLTVADIYTSTALTTKVDKTKLANGDSFVVGNYLYIYNATNSNFKCQTFIDPADNIEKPSTYVVGNQILITFTIANKATLGSSASNYGEITIPVISPVDTSLILSWSKINTGATGATGAAGVDAYTVLLTNEAHTFAGDVSNAVNGGVAETQVLAYKGASKQSVTISTVNGKAAGTVDTDTGIAGLTFKCSAISGTDVKITFTCTNAFVSPSGTIPIVLTVGGVTFTKMFTYSIAFKGNTGGTGATGATGSPATSYWLVSSASVVQKSASGTVVLTPSTLTFTGKSQTGTSSPIDYGCRWIIAYSTDGSTYTNAYTSTTNETTKTFTVDSTYRAIRVRMYLAGGTTTLLDEQIIPVVADGAIGTPGADAVTFQIYSSNGYALSTNIPTVTLQTFAYVGDIAITAGATYQWYVYNNSGWTALTGAANAYLTISRDDVEFSKSYMCKMTFNGVEYTSVATVDDKNDENKVFTTKPSNYAVGDLWIVGVDYVPVGVEVGTLLRAEHTNTIYEDDDWITATKYDDKINDLQNNIDTYNQYFSFDSVNGVTISARDANGAASQFSTSLTNERLSFNYGNESIAYINGTKMNIKEAEIESPLTVTGKYSGSTMLQAPVINIGNFSIIVESNGSLSIVANT